MAPSTIADRPSVHSRALTKMCSPGNAGRYRPSPLVPDCFMDEDARWFPASPSLRQLCDPDLDPLFWPPERRGALSAWWGHAPFAQWLMGAARPLVMVELGTHWGVSYAAFCRAVTHYGLRTRCFAVGTDSHASFYNEGSVYEDFKVFHDERYAAFSTLLCCTLDEGLERFKDGSVDLLHLDGRHTYEAVSHAFQSWLPKFSERGVALLHDINVHEDEFGVWRLWRDLRKEYPHFEFHHCYGLGLLAIGNKPPKAVTELCALNDIEEGGTLRSRVAFIGERWIAEAREHDLENALDHERHARAAADAGCDVVQKILAEAETKLAHTETARAEAETALARTQAALTDTETLLRTGNMRRARLEAAAAENVAKLREANELAKRQSASIATLQSQLEAQEQSQLEAQEQGVRDVAALHERLRELELIEQSTTWRATRVMRGIASRVPRPVRLALRRTAKAGYWALTPHRMPARIKFLRDRRHRGPDLAWAVSGPAAEFSATSPQEIPTNTVTPITDGGEAVEKLARLEKRLRASGLFQPEVYLSLNPDVRGDPWQHFLTFGLNERRPFTDPTVVARLLARLDPEIEAERYRFMNAVERAFTGAGNQETARLFREKGIRIGIFCSSLGNFFMREIADMLAWGLQAEGIDAIQRDETGAPDEPFNLRVFVAPHEFFWLGQGREWTHLASTSTSILYNVEQVQTMWFGRAFPLLLDAPLVLDINFHSAVILREAGCRAVHFLPGHLPETRFTKPLLDISQIELMKGYAFGNQQYNWLERDRLTDRPIDILFVGSRAPRRDRALARLRYLADRNRFFCVYRDPSVPFTQASDAAAEFSWALAQRTKIVLNLHRDWIGYFEWPRMVMGGFWQGACVVSDPGLFNPIFDRGVHYLEESMRHIGELLGWLLETREGREKLDQTRQAGYQRACSVGSMRVALAPVLEEFAALLRL